MTRHSTRNPSRRKVKNDISNRSSPSWTRHAGGSHLIRLDVRGLKKGETACLSPDGSPVEARDCFAAHFLRLVETISRQGRQVLVLGTSITFSRRSRELREARRRGSAGLVTAKPSVVHGHA